MNAETEIRPVLTLLRGGRVEGELPVVTKGPIAHLAQEDIDTIEYAEFLHAQLGREDEAKAIIAALEQKLGITPEDKAAAFGPQEPWEGDLLEALGLQPVDDAPARLPHDFRRPNEAEIRALDGAAAELKRSTNSGNREIAKKKLGKIEAGYRHRIDRKETSDGIRETVELAKARGEEVNEKPARGAVEIESRDGLYRMRKNGHITAEQERVGLIYRAGCEERGADLKAQVITDAGGSGGHDNDAFVAKRLDRAKRADFVARVDRAVALGCIKNPAALQMLRHVAGGSGNISDFGKGRGLIRHREALVAALEVAVRVWRQCFGAENPGVSSMPRER